jgi:hypothetical protein
MSDIPRWQQFELDIAKEFGLTRVPGSGNKWHRKLDVDGHGIVVSCKYTQDTLNVNVLQEDLREMANVTSGRAGSGDLGFMVYRRNSFPNEDVVLMYKDDLLALLQEGAKPIPADNSKLANRRRRATTPALLRREEEDANE